MNLPTDEGYYWFWFNDWPAEPVHFDPKTRMLCSIGRSIPETLDDLIDPEIKLRFEKLELPDD